jgi:hypothetical protein
MSYRALRLIFRLATLRRLLGALFFRARPRTVRRAALAAARCMDGEDCSTFALPVSRILAVESSTTPVAAFAAAPSASPATAFTVLAPRRAALAIARAVFVRVILTIVALHCDTWK